MTGEPTAPVSSATIDAIDPATVRRLVRTGEWTGSTYNVCPTYVHANLIVLHGREASDFQELAQRNPAVFPLLEATTPGDPRLRDIAFDANVTTDYPRYLVYERGTFIEECTEMGRYWAADSVGFATGTSMMPATELAKVGFRQRGIAVYQSKIELVPSALFHGAAAVSAMAVPASMVDTVTEITARYPLGHGAPCHIGDSASIGVDLTRPLFGFDPLEMRAGEVAMFWVTAGTSVLMAQQGRFESVVLHKPAHWLVGDLRNEQFRVGPRERTADG